VYLQRPAADFVGYRRVRADLLKPTIAPDNGVEVKDGIVALAGHVSNTHHAIFLKVLPAYVHSYCRFPWRSRLRAG
jgi:hypothetical protein